MNNNSGRALLLILDGWGINNNPKESAIAATNPPFFNSLLQNHPNSQLDTMGEAVGLPSGVMGNSEVGHENIGAGRVAKQKLTLISEAIASGSFFANKALLQIFESTEAKGKSLHFLGLLSEGDVHSHLGHLNALIDWAEKKKINYFVHPILDGRDDPPKNAMGLLEVLIAKVDSYKSNLGQIADVCGRYWAMDRDNNWDRVIKYWDLLINKKGLESDGPLLAVQEAYDRQAGRFSPEEKSDEFIQATYFKNVDGRIQDGDGVVFFNFRPDRARQITAALTQKEFSGFERNIFPQINYTCLTPYDKALHQQSEGANPVVPVAFSQNKTEAMR
jgi:2,3-bisphosphoglycerate-independent phosphoglycerate mutase